MLFRVVLSTDVDEYYRKDANDVQLHLTVEENSLNAAVSKARIMAESYLLWQSIFEVVSIRLIDEERENDVS